MIRQLVSAFISWITRNCILYKLPWLIKTIANALHSITYIMLLCVSSWAYLHVTKLVLHIILVPHLLSDPLQDCAAYQCMLHSLANVRSVSKTLYHVVDSNYHLSNFTLHYKFGSRVFSTDKCGTIICKPYSQLQPPSSLNGNLKTHYFELHLQ